MALSGWLVAVLLSVIATEQVNGECSLPTDWYEPPGAFVWIEKYSPSNDAVAILFMEDQRIFHSLSGEFSECNNNEERNGWTVASFTYASTNQKYCIEAKLFDQVIYWRTTPRITGGSSSVDRCVTSLGDRDVLTVLVKYLFREDNFAFPPGFPHSGPPDGTYQFAITKYGDDGQLADYECLEDTTSTMTVTGNVISVSSSCLPADGQTYVTPFNGELYIVNAMTDSELNIETDSNQRGVMTLALDQSSELNLPAPAYRFLLVRFFVDTDTGRMTWFFSTATPNDPVCYIDLNAVTEDMKQTVILASIASDECGEGAIQCQNGGTCSQSWLAATCLCPDGFEGMECQTNIDECASNPCANGGDCTDGINLFSCTCPDGFGGPTCEFVDACASVNCLNGGTCYTTSSGEYICVCTEDYIGEHCEVEHHCLTQQPCKNGGTCYNSVDTFLCRCPPGYGGQTCEDTVEFCDPNPCEGSGSTCSVVDNEASCNCEQGRSGPRCESRGPACSPNPCQGRSVCTQIGLDVDCTCEEGRSGQRCQNVVTDPPSLTTTLGPMIGCEGEPCYNDGQCIPTAYGFRCECTDLYDGILCEDLSDWFIVAMVLVGLLGLIFLIMLIICCCYCCCGWRPGHQVYQSQHHSQHAQSEYKTAAAPSPGTVQFNVSPATPYYGIQVMRDT